VVQNYCSLKSDHGKKIQSVFIFALKAFFLSYARNCVLIIDAAVMVVILVTLNPVHDKVSWIQHNVIKFVRDLRQDSAFLRVL
jgi:hypothetical protein